MKKVLFALGLLLVINLSTSTAHAQCSAPTSQYFSWTDSAGLIDGWTCVGSGNLGDYPYGDINTFSQEAHCSSGSCGQCLYGYTPDAYGFCNYPMCVGDQNLYWGSIYLLTMDVGITNAIVGCYYVAYGEVIKPPMPHTHPNREPVIEARWWTFAPSRG